MNDNVTPESILNRLYEVILSRKDADPNSSYVAKLFDKGTNKIGGKIGEEATELAMALVSEGSNNIVNEAADVLFFTLVGLAAKDIPFEKVLDVLKEREGISGLAVKQARAKQEAISKEERETGTALYLDFNKSSDGLIPVVTQDAKTKDVLMLAYMNEEAFNKTMETGLATYWTRSRQKLWVKGETSGQFQKVVEMRVDCDQDAIVMLVNQEGGGACHTGKPTCFYRVAAQDTNGKLILKFN